MSRLILSTLIILAALTVGCVDNTPLPTTTAPIITTNNPEPIPTPVLPSLPLPTSSTFELVGLTVVNISYDKVLISYGRTIDSQVHARLVKGEVEIGTYNADGNQLMLENLQPDSEYTAILYSDISPDYGKHVVFTTISKPIVNDNPQTTYYYGGGGGYIPVTPKITIWSTNVTVNK